MMTQSKKDYLKVLLSLSSTNEGIQSTDIAGGLKVTRASVSRMMTVFKESGYIFKEKYGKVSLTKKGRHIAEQIQKRHDLLKTFLTDVLGVDDNIADNDACNMEHTISYETTKKLAQQIKKFSGNNK